MTDLLFLADFSVIKPDPGLILWTSLIFLIVWIGLAVVAFKPIQRALKKREMDIQHSLNEAKLAREEMRSLKSENEDLLKQAREERAKILREANQMKDNIVNEAKDKARDEARKIVEDAREQIQHMTSEAMIDARNQIGLMALDIAEKVIRKDLKTAGNHDKYVDTLVDELNIK